MNWIVHVKGGPNRPAFEITVLLKNNERGQRSYGWFDDYKLLISSSGGPCRDTVTPAVWKRLLKVAEEVAAELNQE